MRDTSVTLVREMCQGKRAWREQEGTGGNCGGHEQAMNGRGIMHKGMWWQVKGLQYGLLAAWYGSELWNGVR
jgi:hypothetical protein